MMKARCASVMPSHRPISVEVRPHPWQYLRALSMRQMLMQGLAGRVSVGCDMTGSLGEVMNQAARRSGRFFWPDWRFGSMPWAASVSSTLSYHVPMR